MLCNYNSQHIKRENIVNIMVIKNSNFNSRGDY
jgi:hypothetical protein